VADAVTAVSSKGQLVGDGWRLRAERIEMLNDNGWRALVGVRRGLKLLVTWSDQDKELELEAWAGEPEETDGVAVIDLGDDDVRLARVPLCSCRDRGCGNVGIQFVKWLAGNELPALVDLLRDLPWTETIPTRTNVLQGSGWPLYRHRTPIIPRVAIRISTPQGPVRFIHCARRNTAEAGDDEGGPSDCKTPPRILIPMTRSRSCMSSPRNTRERPAIATYRGAR
jgi:hypothetical protein